MMNGVIEGLEPEVIIADQLYDFDRNLFGVEEMSPRRFRLMPAPWPGRLRLDMASLKKHYNKYQVS